MSKEQEVGMEVLELVVRAASEMATHCGAETAAQEAKKMVEMILGVDKLEFKPLVRFSEEEDGPRRLTSIEVDIS